MITGTGLIIERPTLTIFPGACSDALGVACGVVTVLSQRLAPSSGATR